MPAKASKPPTALKSSLFRKKGEPAAPPAPAAVAADVSAQPSRGRASSRAKERGGMHSEQLVSRPFRILPSVDLALSQHILDEKRAGRKTSFQAICEEALNDWMARKGISTSPAA